MHACMHARTRIYTLKTKEEERGGKKKKKRRRRVITPPNRYTRTKTGEKKDGNEKKHKTVLYQKTVEYIMY